MLNNPILRQLDDSLRGTVATVPVEIIGEWATTTRKIYASKDQFGSGKGPFVEVIDTRWKATLTCSMDVGVMAILITDSDFNQWVKAPTIAPMLPIELSFHAYAEYSQQRATFASRIAGASLSGLTITAGADLTKVCRLGASRFLTGCVHVLAQVDNAALALVVLPRNSLKMGRNRLWRLRPDITDSLPTTIQEIFTRRRLGNFKEVYFSLLQ